MSDTLSDIHCDIMSIATPPSVALLFRDSGMLPIMRQLDRLIIYIIIHSCDNLRRTYDAASCRLGLDSIIVSIMCPILSGLRVQWQRGRRERRDGYSIIWFGVSMAMGHKVLRWQWIRLLPCDSLILLRRS